MSTTKVWLDRIYKLLTHEYMLYAIVLSVFAGIYYARAAVSIATGALGVIAVLCVLDSRRRTVILHDRATLALTAVYFVFLVSGLVSSNLDRWLLAMDVNLPFLAIPVGIWAFGPLNRRVYSNAVLLFVVISGASAGWMLLDYLIHHAEYNALYGVGKTIPTPVRHVRYSLFLVLAALAAMGLLLDKSVPSKPRKIITAGFGLILVAAIHVLAVRTGLVALYGGIAGLIIAVVVRERKWKLAIGAVVLMVALSIAAVNLLPSVANKWAYMKWDLGQMRNGQIDPNYSDNIRIASIRLGLEVWQENLMLGTGVGDIEDEMALKYAEHAPTMPAEHYYTPISQYVFWLSALGIIGTIAILALLLYPLYLNWRHSYYLTGIYAGLFVSLVAETGLQLQLGQTLFLVVVCLALAHLRHEMVT